MSNIGYEEEIIDYIKKNSTCLIKISKNKYITKTIPLFRHINLVNLDKMILIYNQIFKESITCMVYVGDIPFEAVSFSGLIAFHNNLYKRPYTYFYKYLPHEIVHQCNGCKIKYVGPAKEWLRESLTEYVQLVMLKEILGEKFYKDQVKEYIKLDTISGNNAMVNLYDFNSKEDIAFMNPLIYGRGVLLFRNIIHDDINLLTQLFFELKQIKNAVSLIDFIDILIKISKVNSDLLMKNYIKGNEVIVNE